MTIAKGITVDYVPRVSDAIYQVIADVMAFADGTIGLAPPLCVTESEVNMMDRLTTSIDDLTDIRD